MRRNLLLLIAAVVPIILAGCASSEHYHANVLNPSEGATLRNWSSGHFVFIYTVIEKVDGVELSIWTQNGFGTVVDPGRRSLAIVGTYGKSLERYEGRGELSATLEPGHSYQVKAERGENQMTLWLEDMENASVVSERKTIEAKRLKNHWFDYIR